MLKRKIDVKQIKKAIMKLAWFLGKKAFLSFLVFAFIGLIVGGIIFYFYAFRPSVQNPEVNTKAIQLNEGLYQKFLENYNERKERFQAADSKTYLNLFIEPQSKPSK